MKESKVLKNSIIRTFNNSEVEYPQFIKDLKELNNMGLDLYVGTDSQVLKDKICIATCICFYKPGISTSKIFYIKNRLKKDRYPTLRSRMLLEAYRSLEVALELDSLVSGKLTVHLDVGADLKRNKTAKFNKELKILVESQGFGCEIKPNSWASSSIADRYTKS